MNEYIFRLTSSSLGYLPALVGTHLSEGTKVSECAEGP